MTTDSIMLIIIFTLITLPYAILTGDGCGPLVRAFGTMLTVPWVALALAPIITLAVYVSHVHKA